MKFLPLLMFLFACSPQAVNDFVQGEEATINKVIQDEMGPLPSQPQSNPVTVPIKKF